MLDAFPREAPLQEIEAALDRDGAALVHDFLDPAQVDALVSDFRPHLDDAPWCNTDDGEPDVFFGFQTKRLHGLLARSATFGELVTHPLMLGLGKSVLGPRCRGVRISTGELMVLGKGQEQQPLHRDADSWAWFPRPRPEILISANVALTDFTLENGATVVAPGSHRWEPERKAQPDECLQAAMPRGSALVYSGNVLHGGGANHTDEIRIGLYAGWILSWLRPLENHIVTNGETALRAAPPEVRELLDFTESGWTVFP